MNDTTLSYAKAGVNIDAGNELIERIKPMAKRTHRPGVVTGLGGFGALFELPLDRYKNPLLVSGTDGVGTKLKLAIETGIHSGVGIDLVAMCANDLVVCGAEPLFFLDYYATGKLNVEQASSIIDGIATGCEQAGAALIGGETAEMPGMYAQQDYDLAGFCVGIVEKENIIDGSQVKTGDALIGIASSGPHSNGYSLIRKIIDVSQSDLQETVGSKTLAEHLLAPTKIYVKSMLHLMQQISVKAISHITGGGFYENIPRVLPDNMQAAIDSKAWQQPEIFAWLQSKGNIEASEMWRTFNCGIGMIVCVAAEDKDKCLQELANCGETAWHIGNLTPRAAGAAAVVIE